MTARRRAPLRKRLLLMLGAAGFALVLAEVGARVWGAITGQPGPAQFLVHDEQLGWRNRPGYDGRHVTADFDVAVHFDDFGARRAAGGEPVQRPAVLAIGDSTTFGWGVEQPQAFAALLGEQLAVDVANLGVSGYGSDQQLLLLRQALEVTAPRLVIVTHTDNDVAEVQERCPYGQYKPLFVVDGGQLRLTGVPAPHSWLTEYSHLWRTLQKRLGAFGQEPLSAAAKETGRDLVRRLYRLMQQECAARGIGFVLVFADADWLRQAAPQDGLRYLDLTATFAALRKSGPVHFANDPHWLPRVHEAVANELSAFVARERLLPAVDGLQPSRK